MLKKGILFLSVLIFLTGVASAAWIPAKSAVNPVNGTLYVINNGVSPTEITSHTYSGGTWSLGNTKTLPAGAKCYSVAVNPDGNRLFLSVNHGTSSKLRVYFLNASGLPLSMFTDANWVPAAGSSPMGLAVASSGTRVFMANSGTGKIHYFDFDNGTSSWVHTGDINSQSGIYDVALTQENGFTTVYTSKKVSSGKVLIYTVTPLGAVSYVGEVTGFRHPTFLKVYGDDLMVTVNGPDSPTPAWKDVHRISLRDDPGQHISQGWVGDAASGAFGWNAIDVSSNGYLVFKRSQDPGEADNNFYRADSTIPNIVNGGDITEIEGGNANPCDSVVIAIDNQAVALIDSDDGSVQILDNSDEAIFPTNASPVISNLAQYEVDGSTPIDAGGYLNYEYYDANGEVVQTVLKFDYSDEDADQIDQVTIFHKDPEDADWSSQDYEEGEFTVNGSTISVTFPSDSLAEGNWEWKARVRDNSGSELAEGQVGSAYSEQVEFQAGSDPDFIVEYTIPDVTFVEPTDNSTGIAAQQPVVLTFTEPVSNFTYVCETAGGDPYAEFDVAWEDDTVTLTHINDGFVYATEYIFTVNTAEDAAGNDISLREIDDRQISFTTRDSNEPPRPFNLISPIEGEAVIVTPTLDWEDNGDDEGDDVTFYVYVDEAFVAQTEDDQYEVAVPLAAGTYSWSVTAVDIDGAETVALNAPQPFEVIEDNGIDPTVTLADPVDDAGDVAINAEIVITFSERMTSATITSDPVVNFNAPTWNEDFTVATFTHDDFDPEQAYALTIAGQDFYANDIDLLGSIDILGDAPHTLDITAASDIVEAVISDISIVRDGGNAGDSVTLTWVTDPIGSAVDVYTISGAFDAVAANWVLEYNGIVDTQTDLNQVATGTIKYYKLVPQGHVLVDADLTSDVAGKFDIAVVEGMNLLSLPLIPTTGASLVEIIGEQVTGSPNGMRDESDEIWKYNPDEDSNYEYAWYIEDSIYPDFNDLYFDPMNVESVLTIEPDEGFWLQVKQGNPTSNITVTGIISDTDRVIETVVGMNLIGTAFPVTVSLVDSALNGPATGSPNGMRDESDEVWKYNAAEDSNYEYAWLIEGSIYPDFNDKWFDPMNVESTIELEPGKGYWIQVKETNVGFTWTYTKPY